MTTLVISHAACLAYDTGEGHPEQPDRLRAIEGALESEVLQMLARDVASRAEISAIARVHPLDYIETIRAGTPTQERTAIDDDTSMSPGTFEAALRSAGGAIFASRGDDPKGQKRLRRHATTRPSCRSRDADQFCFFNNATIAARHAQAAHGAEWRDPRFRRPSRKWHATDLLGRERGEHDQIVNAPLHAGDGGEAFREAMEVAILPRIEAFSPNILVVSARFDGHHRDWQANLNLVEADYAWVTRRLMEIAKKHCSGRVVSVLEGGYDLDSLARSAAAHVLALMEG